MQKVFLLNRMERLKPGHFCSWVGCH